MIYCVEDDGNIRELVVYTLNTTGMEARGFEDGKSFMEALAFETPELILLDIKAVLRRTKKEKEEGQYSVGNLSMDLKKHVVFVDGKQVTLTLKEFELLGRLVQNHNIVLTRDRLLEEVWGYDFDGETRTVDVHVRTLRQKLGSAGDMIQTVRGVGYRLGEINES